MNFGSQVRTILHLESSVNKVALFAVLDWGLGHATRSIPIIKSLIKKGITVHLASSGLALAFLKKQFPNLAAHSLPAYNPTYPVSGNMVWHMAGETPGKLLTIWKEHWALARLIEETGATLVFSDNRYGCFHKSVHSVFITHQINIQMPEGHAALQRAVNATNRFFLSRFDEVWVPDNESFPLAGKLSARVPWHPALFYIGHLSRYEPGQIKAELDNSNRPFVLLLLSGPEPQRTLLENLLLNQASAIPMDFVLVRGVASDFTIPKLPENIRSFNLLSGNRLSDLIENSELVVARSGYSTIMDLQVFGKKALFIPTPGQTEQELLAENLSQLGLAATQLQDNLDLKHGLEKAKKSSGLVAQPRTKILDETIQRLLNRINCGS